MAIKKSVNDAGHCLEVYSWCRTMIVQYVDKFLIVYWPLAWQHETYLLRCIKYLFLISRLLVTYFTGGVKGCSFFDPIHNQTDRKLTLLSMALASAKVREGKEVCNSLYTVCLIAFNQYSFCQNCSIIRIATLTARHDLFYISTVTYWLGDSNTIRYTSTARSLFILDQSSKLQLLTIPL